MMQQIYLAMNLAGKFTKIQQISRPINLVGKSIKI